MAKVLFSSFKSASNRQFFPKIALDNEVFFLHNFVIIVWSKKQ
ncbi:hypothetical protein BSM4216_2446 [Bacillus smithii]|nr:hypothetical protein BSM4216_2446 [Bacillus smithii]